MAPQYGRPHAFYQRDTVSLPAKLLQTIPTCAQECVSSTVVSSFVPDKCKSTTDGACLCSNYSTSGFTFGEVVLGCVYSNCSAGVRNASEHAAFDVCSVYTNTVTATHSVLTLTTLGGTSSTSSSTIPTPSSTITEATAIPTNSTTLRIQASSTRSISPATSTTPASSSGTSSNVPTTPTHSPEALTTGQTIGISIASIAIAALLFGLCFFCCCCVRRRKKEKKSRKFGTPTRKWFKSSHRLDFQDQSSPTGSKFPSKSTTRLATSSPEGPVRPLRSYQASPNGSPRSSFSSFAKSPETATQRHSRPSLRPQLEWWRETSRPDIRQVPDGLKSHRASIASPSHSETGSLRLPTPLANITINLKKASKQLRPDSAATRWTVFEEDCKTPAHKKTLPASASLPRPLLLAPLVPLPGPSFADRYTTSPEEMTKSELMLEIPRKPVRHDEISAHNGISLVTGISRNDHLSMPPSSAASYLPAYYTSSDSRTPVAPKRSPNDHERFSQPHFAPMPLMPRHVRSSWTSATTFESVNPDETTPENEVDKQLSPVSYPKVPRPSNQAIPRSSSSTTSSRKVTLAAKRRGEDLSLDLGRGLMITHIREIPESSLRKHESENKRRNDQTPQMELKSPLWEPKLTPSRRGDDLFLSVEVKGR